MTLRKEISSETIVKIFYEQIEILKHVKLIFLILFLLSYRDIIQSVQKN